MFKKFSLGVSVLLLMSSGIFAQGTGTSTASTTAKSTKTPVFRATKDQIKQVQTMLKDKSLYKGDATGTLNDDTRAAIKSFQKDNGLTQTGTLNRATLEKFGVELTESQKAIPVSASSIAPASDDSDKSKATKTASTKSTTSASTGDTVKRPAPFRANKDQIMAAQKILRDGKMLTGGEDGKLDDPTREGLGKYQAANGMKPTKTLNAATLEKMGIALTDKQKEQVAAQAAYDAAKAPKN